MIKDKHGKRLYRGDLVLVDADLVGLPHPMVMRVRYHNRKYGWVGERLVGDPRPQCLGGLQHRIERVPKGAIR